MPIDGPSRDPRTELPAAIAAASSDDLDGALSGILAAAIAALVRTVPRSCSLTRIDADPRLAASVGFREGEVDALARTTDIAGVTATPLVIGRGGVEAAIGSLILLWPAARLPARRP